MSLFLNGSFLSILSTNKLPFNVILQFENDLDLKLQHVLPNLFKIKTASEIWTMLNQGNSGQENERKFSFFQALPDESVNTEIYDWLLDFLREE